MQFVQHNFFLLDNSKVSKQISIEFSKRTTEWKIHLLMW